MNVITCYIYFKIKREKVQTFNTFLLMPQHANIQNPYTHTRRVYLYPVPLSMCRTYPWINVFFTRSFKGSV